MQCFSRSLLRCCINALKVLIPDLEEEILDLPAGAIALGGNYVLLRRQDKVSHEIRPCEEDALVTYLRETFGDNVELDQSPMSVNKWARVRLPNGQVARSAWGEYKKTVRQIRMSRNVKIIECGSVPQICRSAVLFQKNCKWHRTYTGACFMLFPPSSGPAGVFARDPIVVFL